MLSTGALKILVRGGKITAVAGCLTCISVLAYKNRFKILRKIKPPDLTLYEYKGYKFTSEMLESVKALEDFQARQDDIYVITYPKSGTTWVQELVYVINNKCNFAEAKSEVIDERFPFLEMLTFLGRRSYIENMKSPRLIKTHLPYETLPEDIKQKKCKIIYCTRNPKDVSVSYYNFTKFLVIFDNKISFSEFFEQFINDNVLLSPYWQHNITYWNLRHEPNVLFLKYEDMHKDCAGVVGTLAEFLDRELSVDQVQQVVDHCRFSRMKENDKTNYTWLEKQGLADGSKYTFMRKGKVGDWKSWYTVEMNERMDQKYAKEMANTDLRHEFDIH